MWKKLPEANKLKYKTLISNFASLSEAFSQKSESVEDTEGKYIVAPIVNSKFQETVFQKSFNATSEDIANTSYDASIKLDTGEKYLVGIKAFGIDAKDQKIAQFKSASSDWVNIIGKIRENAESCSCKEEINKINEPLYRELALKIADLRNKRLNSSKAQIKGFQGDESEIQAVYHVLMTTKKNELPKIFVGEIPYEPVDIDNIVIEGTTGKVENFKFNDGKHIYKYTTADSQLFMNFDNKNIILEEWDVNYIQNPFDFFENLSKDFPKNESKEILESVSWIIEIEEASGFNAFNGGSKLSHKSRKSALNKFINKHTKYHNSNDFNKIITELSKLLLEKIANNKNALSKRRKDRESLLSFIKEKYPYTDLYEDIEKLVCRSATEVYIPIPNSFKFHRNNPHFFGENFGTFKEGTNQLVLNPEERVFNLEFIPSGNIIQAYINQDNGKAIQSKDSQDILGEWLLYNVFQLKYRELLTYRKLNDLGINGIRLVKFTDSNRGIGLEFIWIDPENPPKDFIGT